MVARLFDYDQITNCCYYFLGITVVNACLTIISIFFLSLFSYNVLCQQSPITSIYHFFHSSPTLSKYRLI